MRAVPDFPVDRLASVGDGRRPPLIAHVIYRLDVGGLENGLVNLINRIPENRYSHAVVCLTGYTGFRSRIRRSDVQVFALNKPEGNSPAMHFRLWRLFRRLRPQIVHTRNLAALESTVAATLAGVPARVHGEHGRDVGDLDGSSVKHQRLRRMFSPFVHRYIALSRDLEQYLVQKVGIGAERVTHLCNGVDVARFAPASGGRKPLPGAPFSGEDLLIIGTVGRLEAVKDQLTLARAFVRLVQSSPHARRRARLAIIGSGSLMPEIMQVLAEGGVADLAWVPGARDDVPEVLRALDLFVLPSLAEGISNTILESMASGLPVIATRVGGNPELVEEGVTGTLVPAADPESLAEAMAGYLADWGRTRREGQAARRIAVERYSLEAMVNGYVAVYDQLLQERNLPVPAHG